MGLIVKIGIIGIIILIINFIFLITFFPKLLHCNELLLDLLNEEDYDKSKEYLNQNKECLCELQKHPIVFLGDLLFKDKVELNC